MYLAATRGNDAGCATAGGSVYLWVDGYSEGTSETTSDIMLEGGFVGGGMTQLK